MIATSLWFASVAVLAWLLRSLARLDQLYPRPRSLGRRSHADEWHHGYAALLAFPLSDDRLELLRIIPLLIALEDAYQHHRQISEPWYLSPLHALWLKLHRRRPT